MFVEKMDVMSARIWRHKRLANVASGIRSLFVACGEMW